jgi:chemotaxis protein CheC
MSIDYKNLSSMQLDAIRELGNIGAGHAATTLSNMINQTIMISVTKVALVSLREIKQLLGEHNQAIAISLNVQGDFIGSILLCLELKNACSLIDIISNKNIGDTINISDIEENRLKEAGSVLAASYLNAIGDFANLKFIITQPSLLKDTVGNILENKYLELERRAKFSFCIETDFIESSNKIKGYFLLIPELKSLELILNSFGLL